MIDDASSNDNNDIYAAHIPPIVEEDPTAASTSEQSALLSPNKNKLNLSLDLDKVAQQTSNPPSVKNQAVAV